MTDDEMREYLRWNPAALREFVRRDMRADPGWWRAYLQREARIAGGMALSRNV